MSAVTFTVTRKNGDNYQVVVSALDIERVSKHSWSISFTNAGKPRAEARVKGRLIRLHRFLLQVTDPKLIVDHINGDSLDNRRENLRLCSNSQNLCNRGKTSTNTSGLKGVTWSKHRKKWVAQIKANYRLKYLGGFDSKEEAHLAYIKAAEALHGEYTKV